MWRRMWHSNTPCYIGFARLGVATSCYRGAHSDAGCGCMQSVVLHVHLQVPGHDQLNTARDTLQSTHNITSNL